MNVLKQNLLSLWNNEVPALPTELGQNLPPLFSSQGELLLPGGEQHVRVRVALEQRQQVFGSGRGGGGEYPGHDDSKFYCIYLSEYPGQDHCKHYMTRSQML